MGILNGKPKNGSTTASSSAPHDWMRETESPTSSRSPWPSEEWPAVPSEETIERSRLEAELATARARTAIARQRAAERDAVLRAEIVDAQQRLVDLEREHGDAVAEVRAGAQAEVARIMAAARAQVAEVTRPPADVIGADRAE